MSNNDPFIVSNVDFDKTKLIDNADNFHNEFSVKEAKELSISLGLDLVCFNKPSGKDLALCKIIDFGKWKYSNEKKKKKLIKENKTINKELRFSPQISDHDIEHKVNQGKSFLDDGAHVSLTMKLKGRQRLYFNDAVIMMNKIVAMFDGDGEEVSRTARDSIVMVKLSPVK